MGRVLGAFPLIEVPVSLDLSTELSAQLQANVATTYSLTYLFGQGSIMLFVTRIATTAARKNLRKEAVLLAGKSGADEETRH